ncbi:MAG: hypothetical protein NVSMB14_03390 [Isosphaeraceae bacterium]
MQIRAAAIQMAAEPMRPDVNLDRADAALRQARDSGVELAVLPELFNTGYGYFAEFHTLAERVDDGPTWSFLKERSRRWDMAIAAGFVEQDGGNLYDSLGFVQPDGRIGVYRKRNLVFWERARFRPGRSSLIVPTRWGRLGFAICADMIYGRIWREYRDHIDLAIISAAWPEFAHRSTGRGHWLFGRIGPLSAEIPRKLAVEADIPVIFANQCGPTRTKIPAIFGAFDDRFAGQSSLCDGRRALPVRAGRDETVLVSTLTLPNANDRGNMPCRSTSRSALAASSSAPVR